jgi:3-oxoisoapionate kinase
MQAANRLLYAFYGDDFTGSTDVLEVVAMAGLQAELFLAAPTAEELARRPHLHCVGVAGLTRSLAPDAMRPVLQTAFSRLRELNPRLVHYKVCSTFDSSPKVGSIGCAIEVGDATFRPDWVPLLVAAPDLGRYCAFGNLFARMGAGTRGVVYRVDRHPAMSRHPVTPADESDLRLHLSRQTSLAAGLLDVVSLESAPEIQRECLRRELEQGAKIVLIDALSEHHLRAAGALIEATAPADRPLFSVGSSGLTSALVGSWKAAGCIASSATWTPLPPAERLFIVSGSCSPVTARQIDWAEANGFQVITFDAGAAEEPLLIQQVSAALQQSHTILCSSRGTVGRSVSPDMLGQLLGRVARHAVVYTGVRRVVIAGGDTSSYAARALGIKSLSMLAPLSRGAPFCRAHAPGDPVDGVELNFKGGQVGSPDYFGAAVRGRLSSL